MSNENAIGVFDSGIGGLSVLKHFIRFLPNEKYLYLGDTARVPYGNKSEDTVIEYAKQCAYFFLEKQVKLIIIACNTVSAVALEHIREIVKAPVVGMILPASSAAVYQSKNGLIGIIGTRATIQSDAYNLAILNLSGKQPIKLFSRACPLFVPIVEEGWWEHPAAKLIAEEYLNIFYGTKIDSLILGCTHYPMLKNLISNILPGVNLIDTGEQAAIMAKELLIESDSLNFDYVNLINKKNYQSENKTNSTITKINEPIIDFYVTDIPLTFFELAEKFLGFKVKKPIKINLGK